VGLPAASGTIRRHVRTLSEEESQHQHDDTMRRWRSQHAGEERAAVSDEGEDGPEDGDERQGLGQEPVPLLARPTRDQPSPSL
jgi:hypothetical protein